MTINSLPELVGVGLFFYWRLSLFLVVAWFSFLVVNLASSPFGPLSTPQFTHWTRQVALLLKQTLGLEPAALFALDRGAPHVALYSAEGYRLLLERPEEFFQGFNPLVPLAIEKTMGLACFFSFFLLGGTCVFSPSVFFLFFFWGGGSQSRSGYVPFELLWDGVLLRRESIVDSCPWLFAWKPKTGQANFETLEKE